MHGQSIFDFFSPANSDEVRKQQIYKIVEQRFIPLNDMLGVYEGKFNGESIDYLRSGIRGFDEIPYEMEKIEN
jgi:hypothetical protein